MTRAFLVGIGGFVGAILRYWLSGVAQAAAPRASFPVGTLVVNVLGCLAIGVVAQLAESRGFLSSDTRALVIVGVLGGFTTFSAFATETVSAMRDGATAVAAANIVLSVTLCLAAVWAGRTLAVVIWR